MAISNDLFLAILAMDAYNRGYDAGIADGEGPTDANGNDADGLGEAGKQIGTATVLNVPLPEGSEAAGFYAIAYEWTDAENNTQTVISYRAPVGPSALRAACRGKYGDSLLDSFSGQLRAVASGAN